MSKHDTTLTRRMFLQAGGLLGAGLALTPLLGGEALAGLVARESRQRVEATRFQMGTFVTITALHASRDHAEQSVLAAFDEIARLEGLLSRHDASTPLAHLNRFGLLRDAPHELMAVLESALQTHRFSGGVFDPSVAPVVELMRRSGSQAPSAEDLRSALELVDAGSIELGRDSIRLGRSGMALTLDGIGKGYIVDKASEMMTRCGVQDHLINAGGDIRASGRVTADQGWRVAIENPVHRGGNYPCVLDLRDLSVATSGAYEQSFGGNRHHIVRPDSGVCPGQALSVSVVAPSVMEADALATALFASPVATGLGLVDSLPGRECFVVSTSGRRAHSRHWTRYQG
ncbi:MAG: FAD:protein FMN transferase [Desulfovibrionaceae bacterium]